MAAGNRGGAGWQFIGFKPCWWSPKTLRRAIAYGTVVASFTIGDFSLAGLQNATRDQIEQRLGLLDRAMRF